MFAGGTVPRRYQDAIVEECADAFPAILPPGAFASTMLAFRGTLDQILSPRILGQCAFQPLGLLQTAGLPIEWNLLPAKAERHNMRVERKGPPPLDRRGQEAFHTTEFSQADDGPQNLSDQFPAVRTSRRPACISTFRLREACRPYRRRGRPCLPSECRRSCTRS